MTSPTPAPPAVFSELTATELCKWCQSDVEVDGRGLIVCPHCDRPCSAEPCELCARVHFRMDWTADEAVAAADTSTPCPHVGRPRRFWQALRTWLPPWPLDWSAEPPEDVAA